MPRGELDEIQTWFQAAVVRPSLPPSRRGASSEAAEVHVLHSRTLTAQERVEIYADMHVARLVNVLAEDYPAVRAVAGHDDFDVLARGYLADHPPRSFTLSVLGRHLPEWIASNAILPRRELLTDLARLELAMTRVFDAPRESVLAPADIAALPPSTWADPRPRLISALELLEFEHRANAIVRAVRQGEDLPPLDPARTRVLVWRKDDVVWRQDLDPVAFAALHALWERASLADAIAAAEKEHGGDPAELEPRVAQWMSDWSQDGLFSSIE
ncbi:MAG: DNA-binding domain-containing protein [Planctomycetota bacterium]|nr:DNA-binding domain-containing protein [Planctomycetota bacterium]